MNVLLTAANLAKRDSILMMDEDARQNLHFEIEQTREQLENENQ